MRSPRRDPESVSPLPPEAGARCVAPTAQPTPALQLDVEVEGGGLKEGDAWPAQPQDAYGLEKLATEELCMHYDKDFGIQCRIARFHNIYGEPALAGWRAGWLAWQGAKGDASRVSHHRWWLGVTTLACIAARSSRAGWQRQAGLVEGAEAGVTVPAGQSACPLSTPPPCRPSPAGRPLRHVEGRPREGACRVLPQGADCQGRD